jgi:hypothetical protein
MGRLIGQIQKITLNYTLKPLQNKANYLQICLKSCWGKMGVQYSTVHHFFIFKKAYDLVRREVLYNILIEFAVPMKLVRLIKMCLNETYSNIHMTTSVV